jgi:hypothetical protein
MSESVTTPAIKSEGSFASLFKSFSGPAKNINETWDTTALLDDVATISYEQALRSNRRVPPVAAPHASETPFAPASTTTQQGSAAREKKRKSSSITIRLTEEEEIQLQERAAAAQLSVSAYLRSCIFEAESLRAQVKEALIQIRSTAITPQESCPKSPTSAEPKGFHLFSRWSRRNKTEN